MYTARLMVAAHASVKMPLISAIRNLDQVFARLLHYTEIWTLQQVAMLPLVPNMIHTV